MELAAVLYNIRSVHNVGSIFRTADGAGFTKIYLTGITPSPLDRFGSVRPDFGKVALGAEKGIAWEKKTSAAVLLRNLQKEGYRIFALEQSPKAENIFRRRGRALPKIALMVGEETKGIPSSILALADKILEIPMYGRKESLNVAVAFGIAAYALAESRQVR